MNSRPLGPLALLWVTVALLTYCFGCGEDETGPVASVRTGEVRLTSHYNSTLSIGEDPILEFPYDARGPDSLGTMTGSLGTMTDQGDGTATLFFPEETMYVTDLYFVPGLNVYVDILPKDMMGTIDFCTNQVDLSYDADFCPMVFGKAQAPLKVVTEMTTGTSSRQIEDRIREVTGRPLDEKGDLLTVSVAVVPETEDPLVNRSLNLPTFAVSETEVHLDFPQGRFSCPGDPPLGVADHVHMAVGKDGLLSISFLGSFVEFPYDGKTSDGVGAIGPIVNGRAPVTFSNFNIPPLQIIPGLDYIRIEITPQPELSGSIDLCTGLITLNFDATFTPFMGQRSMTPLSIVTTMTTETSYASYRTVTGKRLDRWGDALLVGVAEVPPTGNPLIDFMLNLPDDAVCQLPVHLDFVGGERPRCQ